MVRMNTKERSILWKTKPNFPIPPCSSPTRPPQATPPPPATAPPAPATAAPKEYQDLINRPQPGGGPGPGHPGHGGAGRLLPGHPGFQASAVSKALDKLLQGAAGPAHPHLRGDDLEAGPLRGRGRAGAGDPAADEVTPARKEETMETIQRDRDELRGLQRPGGKSGQQGAGGDSLLGQPADQLHGGGGHLRQPRRDRPGGGGSRLRRQPQNRPPGPPPPPTPARPWTPWPTTKRPGSSGGLIASLGFLLVLMYFSMGHMMWGWPLPAWFEGNHVAVALVQMLLAVAVMVINQKFFVSGFKSLAHGAPNMDTLVALGSSASFVWSTYAVFVHDRRPAARGRRPGDGVHDGACTSSRPP